MKDIANTNVSFSFLQGSSDFLNLILNNINGCVLLLDKEMHIRAFNNAVKTIFPKNESEDIYLVKCGEAIGCAYQVDEQKECGKTSQCASCDLRLSAMHSYLAEESVYKEHIVKPFFNSVGQKIDKHLQFSTRFFNFDDEKYIILIVEELSVLNN